MTLIDGVTPDEISSEMLKEIYTELKTDSYKATPVRRVEIRQGKKTRKLGLPTVKDKIVQQSTRSVLEPIFDKDFHPSSYV